jgi:hypothetical protein
MQNKDMILEQLKRTNPSSLPKAVQRYFPAARASTIINLVRTGCSMEEAITLSAPPNGKGKRK